MGQDVFINKFGMLRMNLLKPVIFFQTQRKVFAIRKFTIIKLIIDLFQILFLNMEENNTKYIHFFFQFQIVNHRVLLLQSIRNF